MWLILILLMAGGNAALAAEEVVVRMNGQALLLSEIDAPSRPTIIRLQEALVAQAARTIDRLIDQPLAGRESELRDYLSQLVFLTAHYCRSSDLLVTLSCHCYIP